ncbi:hypothetical protein QBC42DRAFT_263998 [Cladorrhinum samala]|uniref:SnoaL-like domain-containing protein n=1 Tax=Cladorrhinum samala TaxID=585594 RepID=A0AAV9HWJ3_9PEZI|nr:hypothetical protein QBC42DRAFT_263998 [Cladorrhinum samala]
MSSYTIPQYLLDRANIHDTVAKIPLYYDTRNLSGLLDEVYAPEVHIDYTSIIGGEPFTITREEWIERVGKILEGFASTQHVTSGIITNLPQPTSQSSTRPTTVTVHAQVSGNLVGHPSSPDGSATLSQNGGLLEAELQFFPSLESQSLNPWRITKYKTIKGWEKGDDSNLHQRREEDSIKK